MPGHSTHASEEGATPELPAGGRSRSSGRLRSILDWLFRDRRTGRIVVAQFPNVALWLWLATIVLGRFVEPGTIARELLGWAGLAALGWWSVDELVRGVNPWRRFLGLIATIVVIVGVAAQLPG